jgi:hypothetical protein
LTVFFQITLHNDANKKNKGEKMKTKKLSHSLFFVILIVFSLACSSLTGLSPTVTPENTASGLPTNTPNILPTNTQKPTSTPRPTQTPIPATATAVPMKLPATNTQYEVKVLYASYFAKVFSGGFEYTPLFFGGKFLDVGIMVRNLLPESSITVPWQNIYIIDSNNEAWYPNFGGFYAPQNKDEKFDPATLYIYPEDSIENVTFTEVVYIRAIWATDGARPATYLFGFDTAPLIEVVID